MKSNTKPKVDFEFDKNFQLSQYENWTTVLRRIKDDEQKWINTLLIIYGALLTFQVNNSNFLSLGVGFNLIGLLAILVINLIIAFSWFHQSLNLRTQYYRSMIEIHKIKLLFNETIPDSWANDNFYDWRKNATRPLESKIVDFILLSGLMFVSESISLIKHGQFSSNCTDCKNVIITAIFALLYLVTIIIFPVIIYPYKDIKNLKSIHKTIVKVLRKQ